MATEVVKEKKKVKKDVELTENGRVLTPEERFKKSLAKAKKLKKLRGSANNYLKKLGPGEKVRFRILPPFGGMQTFFYEAGMHSGFKIADRDRQLACLNGEPKYEENCPVCEFNDAILAFRDGAKKSVKEALTNLVYSMNGTKRAARHWVNVALLEKTGDKEAPYKFNGEIKVASLSATNIDKLTEAADSEDFGNIFDPVSGHDVIYSKGDDRGKMSPFDVKVMPLSYDIQLPSDWEKKATDLSKKVVTWMNREEMLEHIHSNFTEELELVEELLPWTEEERHPPKPEKKSKYKQDDNEDEETSEEEAAEE